MKYVKLKSLTWWSAVVPGIAGLVVASEPIHGAASIVQTIDGMTGGVPAAVLINGALVGIGLRAAIK